MRGGSDARGARALAGLAQSKSEGGEWTCNPDDDFWYLDGVKTEYGSCSSKGDGKEGDKEGKTAAACVRTDPGVDTSVYPEICIPAPAAEPPMARGAFTRTSPPR